MAQPSLEELKPEIDKHLQYLKKKLKFAKNDKTFEALHRLFNIMLKEIADPEAFAIYVQRQGFCKTILNLWGKLSKYCTKDSDQGQRNLDALLRVTCNTSDKSRVFGDELVALGFVAILLKVIGDINLKLDDDWSCELVSAVLGVLHNCIRLSDSNRTAYRNANAIGVLRPLLESGNGLFQMKALMVLAYVVNEKERDILATSKSGLKLLLALLKGCVASSNQKPAYLGEDIIYSAFEILDAINQLAINDSSKAEVEKQGAIPDIIRMLEEDFYADEHLVAVEALWNLSFVESIRVSELLQAAIPTLEKLGKSGNRDLRRVCASALWQIKDRTTETHRPSCAEKAPPTYQESLDDTVYIVSSETRAAVDKIMLSYQWDHQKCVLKIRDKLERDGYQVWMDVSYIEGDILGAMAKAVEESDVILMCMSERYRDSNSCRREVTYACKLDKKIIPLLVEVGYTPDGWLGLLLGMDQYYACYSDEELDRTMPALRKVISDRMTEDAVDGPITATEQTTSGSLPSAAADWSTQGSSTSGTASSAANQPLQGSNTSGTASSAAADWPAQGSSTSRIASSTAADWSAQDVQDWLREKRLTCPALDDFDGGGLQELHTQLKDGAKAFKDEMKSDFNMDGPTCIRFISELRKIFAKRNKTLLCFIA